MREATGLALLEARNERGLSQLELAHRCRLSQSQIARLETADQGCTLDMLGALAKALSLTRIELMERIEAARRILRYPNALRLYRAGRTRKRAPRLRE